MRTIDSKFMALNRCHFRSQATWRLLWAASFLLMSGASLQSAGAVSDAEWSGAASTSQTASVAMPPSTQEVVSTWESIARRSQTQGPGAGLESSRAAVRARPGSLALLLQLTEILIETGGVSQAIQELDVLEEATLPALLEVAKARVARATGQNQEAAELLRGKTPSCRTVLDRWIFDYERAQVPGVLSADSLEAAIEALERSVKSLPSPWLRAQLGLRAQRMHLLHEVRGHFDPRKLETLDHIIQSMHWHELRWDEARTRFFAARIDAAVGNRDRAEEEYRHGFTLADSLGARRTAGLARSYLGLILDQQQRYRDAAVVRQESVQIFESLGDSLALAYALTGLGWDLDRTGEPAKSVEASQQALALWDSLGNSWGRAQTLNNLGVVWFNAGILEDASRCFDEGLEIATRSGNRYQRTSLLNNIALLEDRRGRPDRAVEIYRELLKLHRESGNGADELDVLNNLGLACRNLGESGEARSYFTSARDLARERSVSSAAPMINLAMILADSGELDAAKEELERAREEARQRGDTEEVATATAWMGRVAQRRGDLEGAGRLLASADSLQKIANTQSSRIPTLIRLGRVQLQLGRTGDALRLATEADSLAAVLGVDVLAPAVNALRAEIYLEEEQYDEARAWARRTIDRWRQVRTQSLKDLDRSSLQMVFCRALRVLVKANEEDSPKDRAASDLKGSNASEVLRLAMEYHNQNLRTPARHASELPIADRVDSMLTEEVKWRARIEDLREELRSSRNEDIASTRLELAEAETGLHACRRTIAQLDLVSSRALAPLPPTLDQLSQFGRGSVLLSYVFGPPDPAATRTEVILTGMREGKLLSVKRIEFDGNLRRKILLWQELLNRHLRGNEERNAERRLAKELGVLLLPVWIAELSPETPVVIAADGALSNLPFTALMVGGETDGSNVGTRDDRRLIEITEVGRSVSLPSWLQSHERAVSTKESAPELVVCGSRSNDIVKRYGHTASIALEDLVTHSKRSATKESSVNESWKSARILHIDSHGIFDPRRPWRSGLYAAAPGPASTFSIFGGSDSFAVALVQQADLMFLDLHNELVTLAACETARMEDSPLHSPLESFAQGLQQAGARSVLGTYWNVDDAVARWSVNQAYRELSRGKTLGEALRETQLELMNNKETRDPFYWASWVVIGDGARRIPLEIRRAPAAAWMWIGLSTVLLILAVASWRRRTTSAG